VRQALNRFTLAALILSDSVLDVLRREVRRISPSIRVESEEIKNVLAGDVLKREVLEGEKAEVARKQVAKAAGKALRVSKSEEETAPQSGDEMEGAVGAQPKGIVAGRQ